MKYLIYRVTNLLNGRFYIGMHSTENEDDGYLGSGKRLKAEIKKYGRENFKKEILERLPSRDTLKVREAEIINEELLADPFCLNLKRGGEGGGPTWNRLSSESQDAQRRGVLKRVGKTLSHSHKKQISRGNSGKVRSPEMRKRIAEGHKMRDKDSYGHTQTRGYVWVTNGFERKFVSPSVLQTFIENGYQKGYTLKCTDDPLKQG